MLTVLHVIASLSPSGGAERLVYDIASQSQGRLRTLVCGAASIDSDLEEQTKRRLDLVGISSSTLAGAGRSRWLGRAKELRRLVLEQAVDVVHLHTPTPLGFSLMERRPASVYTAHSSKFRGWAGPPTRASEFLTVRACSAVVAVSETAGRLVYERTRLPRSRIEVIPNGISISDFAQPKRGRRQVREALGLSGSERVIVVLARVDRNKSHDTLIEALARITRRGARCVAVCAGSLAADQPWAEHLERLAGAHGLTDRFRLIGIVTDPECLLGAADVCVSIGRGESFGLAAVEGMAARIPVVASDIPAHRETSEGGKHCRLVRPGDPRELATALLDALEGRHGVDLAAAQAHAARRYDVAGVAERYLELYRRLTRKS